MSEELRSAAGRHAYAEVERLVVALCAATAEQARNLPAGDPQIRELATWLRELLDWTGIMLRAARAAQADEMRRIPFLKGYLRRQAAKAPQMSFDL